MEGFGDWQSSPVGLESTWKKKKEVTSATMQTEPVQTQEKNIQSHSTATIETQTIEAPKEELESTPYPPSLYAFLAKVIEPMCEALQENLSPFNVRLSDDFNADEERNTDNDATKLHELRSSTASTNLEGSCVSWGSTGNQVAVGYKAGQHENWCTHSTSVSIWNLTRLRPELGQRPAPHKEILFNTCVTALEFHPKVGNLLAVGLYNGEIALIDINPNTSQKDDSDASTDLSSDDRSIPPGRRLRNQETTKLVDGSCHSTPVVGIRWVLLSQSQTSKIVQKNTSPSNAFILSAAKDGLIGIWSLNKTYTCIFLERKFVAYSENLPDNVSVSKRTLSRVKEIGITAMSSCTDDPATFVFATYGSMIFQGNLLTDAEIDDIELRTRMSTKETAPLMNGVTAFVTEQQGYISALDCSPYHRNLVLSATLSGHVLLQNLFQSTPTLQFYMDDVTATDVKWSGRAMMFGVAEGTKLSLFDLLVSKTKPTLVAVHSAQLRAIAFEKTDTGLVATTDENGVLHIWQLPKSISAHQFAELDALIELGQINKASETEADTQVNI